MSIIKPVPPGGIVGILGGGQLGRMMALEAARLGLKSHIYCPDPASPAFDVTPLRTIADYDDQSALAAFADAVDVVTYEFENVPYETAAILSERAPLHPNAHALAVAQDRLTEKTFFSDLGIETAGFHQVNGPDDLAAGLERLGYPAILKTRRFGYDGKGQVRIEQKEDAPAAWHALQEQPCILEAFVPFSSEVSLVTARVGTGMTASYDLVANKHENHILRTSTVPAGLPDELEERAKQIGRTVLEKLDYVGILAIEFFVAGEGPSRRLLVNEIAPRVHNSGHWTEAACPVSQFAQHIRAICGWPLGSTERRFAVEMTNILGHESDDWMGMAATDNAVIHLYGKAEARDGRKMGHITRITER